MTNKYHFFYKDRYLNQWSKSPFHGEHIWYNCMEQYMMFAKASLFHDDDMCTKILQTYDPYKQRQLGRKVRNFNQSRWDSVKLYIVIQGNMLKFSQNPKHLEFLRSTGTKHIVEASPYDRIWGIGYSQDTALDNIHDWGDNLLGKALMTVRGMLC
jgi:ribA/ribD-fused uncharacterized protein